VTGELGEQPVTIGLVGQWLRGQVRGVEELKAIGGDLHRRTRRSPGTDLGICFIARQACTTPGNALGDQCSAIELYCEMAGALGRTHNDKNTALCPATSTNPMTHSMMKLSRIISRAERAR
jgi:hypothetical protein